ncbi:MAG: hypothetical protein ACI81I_000554, partial [Arcobacteraceae bacterium]
LFLVSPDSLDDLKEVDFSWTENEAYKKEMIKRFEESAIKFKKGINNGTSI